MKLPDKFFYNPLVKLLFCVTILGLLPSTIYAQNATCDFSFKKIITLQGSQVVGGPHTDFPVLISHTDPDLATAAGKVTDANGYDIIFADDTGNTLDFQLEKYDGATGQYVAWVLLSSITNGTDVDIHMLYGNSSITTDQSTTAVWGSNYQAVWHLNDDFLDHTSTTYDGVNNGSTDTPAKIADGQNFVDPNDWIELPTFPDLTTDFTMSGWIYTNDNTRAGQRIFADDANNTGGYAFSVGDPGAGRIRFYSRGSNPVILDSPGGTIANNTWHYCVAIADITNGVRSIYVDGALVATGAFINAWGTDAGNASIGGEVASGETANRFHGDLDEVRVANSVLTANWIATEYNSQNQPILTFGASNPGDFYAVASEEDIFHSSIANGDWDLTTTWDSGEVPDGIFENVVISNNVDIDGGSADYSTCNCTLNGDGGSNAFLDINSTRILTVTGDLDANHTGSGGNNNTRLLLNADAVVNVSGDMTWDSPNSNAGSDLQLLLRNNSVLNLTGDLSISKSNGDDVLVDLNNDTQINISGNVLITQDGGDNINVNIDNTSTIDITGNLTLDQSGGDDIFFRLNNNAGNAATLNVGGDVNITHDGGDDMEFLIDDANTLMEVTGDITAVCNGTADSQFLDFNIDNGTLNADAVSLTRGADMGPVEFDMESGAVNIKSLTVVSGGTVLNNGLFGIDVDGDAVFTNSGDFSGTITGGDDFRIRVNINNGSTGRFINTGNLTLNRSDGDDIEIFVDDDDSFFNVGQSMSITSTGGEELLIDLDNDASMDIDVDLVINYSASQDAEINLEAAASNPFLNVDGDVSITSSGGVSEFLLNLNGGTFQIDQDLTLNNTGAGTSEDIDIEIDGDAILNVGGNMSVNLTGGDDIEMDLGNNVGGSTSQVVVDGNATYIQNRSGADHVIRLLVLENTRFEVQGNLTWTNSIANTTLMLLNAANSGQVTVDNDINLNAQSDGDIEVRLENTSELQIGGDFIRQANPNNYGLLSSDLTATVEYIGIAAQLFAEDAGAGTDGFTYGLVEINNTGGTNPQITMEGLATVNAGINFMDGVIASTSSNILVIEDGATTTGASDGSHVDGFVRKIGNTPAGEFAGNGYAFPVGDDDNYQPIFITAPGSSADQFDAQYLEVNPHPTYDNTMLDPSLSHISRVEHWLLETPGTPSVSVRLSWDPNSGGVGSLPDLVVARWDGSTWIDEGNGGTTGNTTAGTVVSAGAISSFSPFTLGTITPLNALPIELLSFTVYASSGNVELEWSTASETDNDFFTIERSLDTKEWETVATMPGAGTSNIQIDYEATDTNPYPGTSFYRLKQTDFDGTFSFSPIEKVFVEKSNLVTVRPVPSTGLVTITSGEDLESAQLYIYNSIGKQVYPTIKKIGARELTVDFNNLSRAVYLAKVITESGIKNIRILITD